VAENYLEAPALEIRSEWKALVSAASGPADGGEGQVGVFESGSAR
jgi:hypothetical protein